MGKSLPLLSFDKLREYFTSHFRMPPFAVEVFAAAPNFFAIPTRLE